MLAVELSLFFQVFLFELQFPWNCDHEELVFVAEFPGARIFITGVTTLPALQDPSNTIQPDYYTSKVSDIIELMGP